MKTVFFVFLLLAGLFLSAVLLAQNGSPDDASKPQDENKKEIPTGEKPASEKVKKETPKEEKDGKKVSFDCRIFAVVSYYYSDSEPEEFRFEALWTELKADFSGINVVGLLDLADEDEMLRKAYIHIPLVSYEKWRDFFALKIGLIDVPFGYLQRQNRYDVLLGYPQILETSFDNGYGFYDLGVSLSGKIKTGSGNLSYEFAVLNGEYAGRWQDTTGHKAFAATIAFYPLKNICFGSSIYDGDRRDTITDVFYNRDLAGGFASIRYNEFSLLGEYIHSNENSDADRTRLTDGAYVEAGIFLWKHSKFWDEMLNRYYGAQILFRWDMLDPPKEEAMKFFTHHTHRKKLIYTVALSVDITNWARITLYWSKLDFGRYWSGYYFGVKDNDNRAGVLLSLQF